MSLKKYLQLFFFSLLLSVLMIQNLAASELTKINRSIDDLEFSLKDMDGQTHKLSDYKGKTLIINFWASWCPPCRKEMPSMERAWQKVKKDNIVMLAINVGEDEDTVFTFLGDYPVTFTILLDTTGKVTEHWPIKGLPTTYVVSPEGKLVYQAIGGREWDDDNILELIKNLNQ